MPVDVAVRDFHFNDNPDTWIQKYNPKDGEAAWEYVLKLDNEFKTGEGFAFWTSENYAFAIERGKEALAKDKVKEELTFGKDSKYSTSASFALAANPFMTSIDFNKLVENNSDIIDRYYLVWTEVENGGEKVSGYQVYHPEGSSGLISSGNALLCEDAVSNVIPPLQAFIVAKGSAVNNELTFDLEAAGLQSDDASVQLRSAPKTGDKLEIIAGNEKAAVLAFIARRENSSDAYKFFAGMNDVPDVYTLKDGEPLGVNIIRSDNVLIPIGLATAYEGNITFTFRGMDSYDANILFIDKATGTKIDLTGKETCRYAFDYVPTKEGDTVLPEENRFFVQFSPAGTTYLNTATSEPISVYSKNKTIYIASGASDPIRQVFVYNMQGTMVYSAADVNASTHTIPYNPDIPEVCVLKIITGQGMKNVKFINK
jgi:hypothetical protein